MSCVLLASCPLGAAAEKAWRGLSLVTVRGLHKSVAWRRPGQAAAYIDPTKIYQYTPTRSRRLPACFCKEVIKSSYFFVFFVFLELIVLHLTSSSSSMKHKTQVFRAADRYQIAMHRNNASRAMDHRPS